MYPRKPLKKGFIIINVVLNPVRSVITVINKSIFDGLFNYRLLNAGGQLILDAM